MYLLKLALRPWRIAPLSQVFAAMTVGFLLLLAGFLFWMERGLKPIVMRLQSEQVITAYLNPEVDAKEQAKIVDSIRTSLGAHAEIKAVGVSEFLEEIQGLYPELKRELEDLGSEMNTIVPRYVSITGVLPGRALDRIKTVPGVEIAESSKDRYQHIVGAFRALRWVARLLAVGLGLALFAGLVQLARMNSHLHGEALALLRLWGAGPLALRMPGLLASSFAGLMGGGIAAVGWFSGGLWLARHVKTLSPMLQAMPLPGAQIGFALLILGGMIGFLAGTTSDART